MAEDNIIQENLNKVLSVVNNREFYKEPIVIPLTQKNNRSVDKYCNIRFLNADVNKSIVDIYVDNMNAVTYLQYSNMTNYLLVLSGYALITIKDSYTGVIINQSTFLVEENNVYTISFINAAGKPALYLIKDGFCNKSKDNSCLRTINLANDAPTLDILMFDNIVLFSNIEFLTVTNYVQMKPATYQLSVVKSENCYISDSINTIYTTTNPNLCYSDILLVSNVIIESDKTYTIYIIGNYNREPYLQLILAESYIET